MKIKEKLWFSECNNTFEIQLKMSALDDDYDCILVFLKMTLDAAWVKDNLALKQFSKIITFCFVKL